MLNEQTLTQLKSLRLDGMVAALADHASSSAATELRFEERLALLVQREIDWRDDKRLTRLLKAARLKVSAACIEDINWRASRGLDRHLITALAGCDWVRHARTILITGATGTGKTWLSCALAQQAARNGFTVLYTRTTRLLQELRARAAEWGDAGVLSVRAIGDAEAPGLIAHAVYAGHRYARELHAPPAGDVPFRRHLHRIVTD